MNPYLSIVIPLHNEAHRLRQSVQSVIRYGENIMAGKYEILLVENGSTDGTFDMAREMSATYRPVRTFALKARSKAQAVRFGMLQAVGDYRYMCDVDLSTPIWEVSRFLRETRNGYDIVIASREHRSSQVETSFKRWAIGRVFHMLVRATTGLYYQDTQCGFKLFTARAAQEIFSRSQCDSMAFDVEALYLADRLGFYTNEIPVEWRNEKDSRVRLVRDSWSMLKDLVRIKNTHVVLSAAKNLTGAGDPSLRSG
jgi:dolichyl-phosphate beta-glucosyltransferase